MFKGISTLLITLALIFLVIALILLILDIIISKMFKNFSNLIESQLQSTLGNNIDEVIDSSFWFKVIAFLVGRKKLKAKIESESSDVIDNILRKFKHKISIKLLGTMFLFLILSVIMCAMFTAVYQLDNSVNATIHTTIDFITDRKEVEEESEVEDTWVWDDIPDEELFTWDEMQSGESSNTSVNNQYDAKVDVSKYGLTADEVVIDASSRLQKSYNIAFISDLHMIQPDEPDINHSWYTSHGITFELRRESFNNSEVILPSIIECLKNEPFDAIIFGGDILDNYSDKNLSVLKQYINQLDSSKMFYIMADHDYLTEMTTNSGVNNSANTLGIPGYIKSLNIGKDSDNLVLIGQNNSNNNITSDGLNEVKNLLNSNKNTLFFSHVPLASNTNNDALREFSIAKRQKVYYWDSQATNYIPNSDQKELMNSLYNSSSLLGTFFGHVHSSWDGELNTGIKEHIFAPAFEKNIGVIRIEGANKNITPGTGNYTGGGPDKAYGHADGKCVVALDDGNYFWYHQSTGCDVTCSWCGNWSKSEWGDTDYHLLGVDGCAVYAMAIVVSNLIGDEITPLEIMEATGCTITLKNDGTYKINTSTSNCFSNRSVSYSAFAKKIAEVYNLDYRSVSIVDNGSVVGANQSLIDSYLADGYYIWGIFDKFKTTWCSNTSSNSANTHFMGIRKKVGDNYYCFTSCKGRCSSTGGSTGAIYTMNYPQGIDSSINAFKFGSGRHAYAFKLKGGTSNIQLKTAGGGVAPGQFGENPMKPPGFTTISDTDIQNDINRGLYSREDYDYLVALSGESTSYEGFYAVACAVRNRVIQKSSTYKNQVTATGQFEGYNEGRVGKPINEQVKCAAVQVLRGERSTVSECMYFFGRVNGYHFWVESDEKYIANWGNNIYYSTFGNLHNDSSKGPESDDIIIYNKDTKVWNISSGMLYKLQ